MQNFQTLVPPQDPTTPHPSPPLRATTTHSPLDHQNSIDTLDSLLLDALINPLGQSGLGLHLHSSPRHNPTQPGPPSHNPPSQSHSPTRHHTPITNNNNTPIPHHDTADELQQIIPDDLSKCDQYDHVDHQENHTSDALTTVTHPDESPKPSAMQKGTIIEHTANISPRRTRSKVVPDAHGQTRVQEVRRTRSSIQMPTKKRKCKA